MGKGSGFGKVILFGEHFVVHGVPGIVSAIDAQTMRKSKRPRKESRFRTCGKPQKATPRRKGFSNSNPSTAYYEQWA